ncbi:MAG: hypothetical protein K9J74_03040 [Sulfuritalea sp.]|nr:hypothetical protein [Sulfuritalea sp.]
MPSFFDGPKKSLRRLLGQPPGKPVSLAAERVLLVFCEHGVEAAQIPRLLPQIGLDDLHTPEKLLAILTPELIDKIAKLFAVRSQWLEGCDDRIYEYLATYKEPQRLLNHLRTLWLLPSWKNEFLTPLRILTTTKCLDYRDDQRFELAPVLFEPITTLGDETIYRYHIYQDGFCWDHAPARIELKAIGRTIWNSLGKRIPLCYVSPHDMEEVLEGRRIPRSLFSRGYLHDPSFEDYILDGAKSVVARETDELPTVFEYMATENLDMYDFRSVAITPDTETEPEANPDAPEPSEAQELSKKSGKRQVQAGNWKDIRTAAKALWAQDDQLSIADMIRRLNAIPALKANKTESAIRKHICDLAPEGIRGKPGRKPKQSG